MSTDARQPFDPEVLDARRQAEQYRKALQAIRDIKSSVPRQMWSPLAALEECIRRAREALGAPAPQPTDGRLPPCGCVRGMPGSFCDKHSKAITNAPESDRHIIYDRIFGPSGSARQEPTPEAGEARPPRDQPETFGELYAMSPSVAVLIEPHEWDNKNVSEQFDWLVNKLDGYIAGNKSATRSIGEVAQERDAAQQTIRQLTERVKEMREVITAVQRRGNVGDHDLIDLMRKAMRDTVPPAVCQTCRGRKWIASGTTVGPEEIPEEIRCPDCCALACQTCGGTKKVNKVHGTDTPGVVPYYTVPCPACVKEETSDVRPTNRSRP